MTYRSYDISDDLWEVLAPHLPGKKGSVGRPSHNNRSFLNGVMWVFRNGSVWRDLPKDTVTGIVSIKDILDGGRKGFGIH